MLPPPILPGAEGIEVAWALHPCSDLAGDHLGVVQLNAECLGIFVIDVSGHGLASSLMAACLHTLFSAVLDGTSALLRPIGQGRSTPVAPREVAARLNRQFPMTAPLNQYFTLLYGVLHIESGRFVYVTAGHPGPWCVRAGGAVESMPTLGTPIGFFEEAQYENQQVTLSSGDRLYLVSDGLLEAGRVGVNGCLGEDRLSRMLRDIHAMPLKPGLDAICKHAEAWSAPDGLEDDVTIVGVACRG